MDKLKAYSVLELPQGASEEEIKEAYRTLAKKYSGPGYETSPLREEAEHKMEELNEAFDTLMSVIRADGVDATRPQPVGGARSGGSGNYIEIREMINTGKIQEALAELQAVQNGPADAEWNFLMGSAYYYLGHLMQALQYFREANRLEPGNREYEAALRNLEQNAAGNMPGNPYPQEDGATAMNCACNTCSMMCCMDACCTMCRGV